MTNPNMTPSDSETENTIPKEWQDMGGNESPKETELPLGSEVVNGLYETVSFGYKEKSDAYKEIEERWKGVPDISTHYDEKSDKYYVIAKK